MHSTPSLMGLFHDGSYVSTVGLDEGAVRQYIQNQEDEDQRLEQLNLL